MAPKIIYIEWEGPYAFGDMEEFDDENCDYGLYQIYGRHPLYGKEVLLYVGITEEQTFARKLELEEEDWDLEVGFDQLSIYLGYLAGEKTPTAEVWGQEIDQAARLLVYVHNPIHNARPLAAELDPDLKDLHVINQGDYQDLQPEVSAARFLVNIADLDEYDLYGRHGIKE